ncbi:hypothetical protein ENUP19_0097G0024 [Entamoeba nuttalli]|uniref:Protein RFT1 homolog n=3 Tax=Entamoeba nuttalli TaxID=412467 RepID=K2HG92_ENTNP|nr:0ligosaccharide translocation protein RFT1, putative [Entamoeba nuttalli P19]EKE41909.1 0ligosaccharide translocation protein RFT1, putative [Entamoeba nuttalli P19]|eukprot:XP_008855756.1 0ligosaccharide translocation protein RFT1, putative [Entamoeba nuttalli P19]
MNSPQQTVGGALRGIASSVLFQLLQRSITFISNVIVIRSVGEEVTGFFHVHLQLLMNIVYFLSREFSRRTIMRKYTDNLSKGISFSLITIIVGLIINIIALPILYYQAPEMKYALLSYCIHSIGLFLELIQEPYLVYMLLTQKHIFRIYCELPSIFIRMILQAILISLYPKYALIIQPTLFALSSLTIFISYHHSIKLPQIDIQMISFKSLKSHSDNLWLFGRQTLQKFLLQEGEKAVLIVTTTLTIQGIFSVISNISSLVVRFLFLPIEDVSYSLFSKIRQNKDELLNAFCSILKIILHLSLLILVFGPPYSKALLDFLYKNEEFTNNSYLLIIAFITISTIAINGISESFFHATATDEQLNTSNNLMFLFSIIYVSLCIVLSKLFGPSGLFISNIISMILRAFYSHYNIYQLYGHLPWKKCTPTKLTLVSLFVVFGINTYVSYIFSTQSFLCLILGVCLGFIELLVIWLCDKPFITSLKMFWNERKSSSPYDN